MNTKFWRFYDCTGVMHLSQHSTAIVPEGVSTHKVVADEEEGLPFADSMFDLVVSSLR